MKLVCSLLQGASSKVMMVNMKNSILISFLMAALVSVNVANAVLYKGLDSEGNVIYSDRPFDDAEKFTPPPISVMDVRKVDSEKEAATEEKPAEFKYTRFDIVSPVNGQTIWNETELTVSMQLTPVLNGAEGHNAWLLMDGKPVIKNSQSMSLQIEGIDRGAHQLQGQIRDKEGRVIVRTRTIVVYIQRASVR